MSKARHYPAIPVLTLLFLLACGLSSPVATSGTEPAAGQPTSTLASTPPPTGTAQPTISNTSTPMSRRAIRRVIVLSMDGLRPDAIELTPMPNVLELMKTSAYSLTAQTVRPSATLPAHASMLTGLCPSGHGVDWNDYLPQNGIAQGIDLFDLAHAAGMQNVMYVGKEKLQQVTDASSIDRFVFINDRDKVVMQNLLADFPQDFGVLFIHFATTDDMGHVYGWLSPEQFSVIFRADEAIGELLNALDAYGLQDETLLIITSDHGGHETTHGSSRPEDMTIPWIASGPGIQAGKLTTPVYTMDTAATAAYALGLPIPAEWDGVPVLEAFGLPAEERPQSVCSRWSFLLHLPPTRPYKITPAGISFSNYRLLHKLLNYSPEITSKYHDSDLVIYAALCSAANSISCGVKVAKTTTFTLRFYVAAILKPQVFDRLTFIDQLFERIDADAHV